MARTRLTREESRRQTREGLLEAAAQLFAERGVNGASIEQIAESAGYTRGAFYSNFADKDELVLELLEQRTRRELEEIRQLGADADSFDEALERVRAWNRARSQHLEGWLALRLELILHAMRRPQLRARMQEREQLARHGIRNGLTAELARRGAEPPADPAQLALIVHALEDGLLIQKLIEGTTIPDTIVVDATALLLDAWAALGTTRT